METSLIIRLIHEYFIVILTPFTGQIIVSLVLRGEFHFFVQIILGPTRMEESRIQSFSEKIDRLLAHVKQLEADNAALREQQDDWHNERATLLQKNDLARNKIEAMIGRLKAMEHS